MKNQTAIESLIEKIQPLIDRSKISDTMLHSLVEEHLEMEKQHIMNAVYDSMGTNFDPNMGRAEQYYNETFKK
jgi:acetolactate synthase small subunit